MAILPLILYPNPMLKEISKPVEEVNDEIRSFIDDMKDTMYFENGAGLAAVQVGKLLRIMLVDVGRKSDESVKNLYVMINPEITYYSEEKKKLSEGCLSFPGGYEEIERAENVKVTYLDYNGQKQELHADDWLARAILHEFDHLEGKTIPDRLSMLKKDSFIRKVKKHFKKVEIDQRIAEKVEVTK